MFFCLDLHLLFTHNLPKGALIGLLTWTKLKGTRNSIQEVHALHRGENSSSLTITHMETSSSLDLHFPTSSIKTVSRKVVLAHLQGTITKPISTPGHSGLSRQWFGLLCVKIRWIYQVHSDTKSKKMFTSCLGTNNPVVQSCRISPTEKHLDHISVTFPYTFF